jgi:hypothetical protein
VWEQLDAIWDSHQVISAGSNPPAPRDEERKKIVGQIGKGCSHEAVCIATKAARCELRKKLRNADKKRRRSEGRYQNYSANPQRVENALDFVDDLLMNSDSDTRVCAKATQLQMKAMTLRGKKDQQFDSPC